MKEYQLWKALSEQLKRRRADVKKTLGQMSVEWAKHTAKLVAGKARVTCLLALATIDMSVFCVLYNEYGGNQNKRSCLSED